MVFKAVQRDGSGASFGPAIANSNARYVIASKPVDVSTQQLHAVMGAPVEELMSEYATAAMPGRHGTDRADELPDLFRGAAIAWPLNELSLEAKKLKSFNLDERHHPLADLRGSAPRRRDAGRQGGLANLRALCAEGAGAPGARLRRRAEPRWRGTRSTIMFLDLDGFTSFAENSTPDEITQLLSDFFSLASQEIAAGGGCATSSSATASWRSGMRRCSPRPCDARLPMRPEHPDTPDASQCAETPERFPPLQARIGIHSGPAVIGNVGSADRLEYTARSAMGNTRRGSRR